MAVEITPHPEWVAELDTTLEPSRQAILDTPVIIDASENQLVDGQIQNFLVSFYPIIRDFPQWLQMLLDRSPPMGREFFTDNIRVERRHDAMWRAMGDGFNVHKKRFQEPEPMIPEVKKFHAYLTEMCRNAEFGTAVSATNYAVEGVAQKISEKALRGLAKNAGAELLGWQIGEVVGQAIADQVAAGERAHVASREDRVLAGEPQRYETKVINHRTGEERDVAVSSGPFRVDGELIGTVATL